MQKKSFGMREKRIFFAPETHCTKEPVTRVSFLYSLSPVLLLSFIITLIFLIISAQFS